MKKQETKMKIVVEGENQLKLDEGESLKIYKDYFIALDS
jgi:hypothetical protein